MQPISEKREAQFRGPSSSEDFNKWMDDSYYDLIQLFNFATEYGIKIPRNMEMLVVENVSLQKKLSALQSLIDNIDQAHSMQSTIVNPEMTSNVTPSPYIVSCSSAYSDTYEGWKAFNGTTIDGDDAWMTANGTVSGWLSIDLNAPTIVNCYRLAARNIAGGGSFCPRDWTFEGSNNNLNWDILDTRVFVMFQDYETKTFAFQNNTPYRYYRINITSNWTGTDYISIGELTLYQTSQNKVLYKSFASSVTFADSTDGINLEHDTDFGLLKIPCVQKEISKIYLVDLNKQNFIPKTFQAKVYESVEPIDIKEATIDLPDVASNDSNLLDMFDGDKSSFWLRKTIKDSSVSDVYFCIELDLPINIINHTRANILTIDPTPLSSITLLDIYYRTVNDWQRLPSYPTKEIGGQIQPVEINDLGRMKFCFPTRDVVGVRIYCKQSNWFLENEMRNFYYGFRNIDVKYVAFRTETSKIRVAFDIPDQEKMFTSILSVKPIFSDGSIAGSDLFSVYKIHYNLAGQDREANLGEPLPAGVQRVYVEIGLMLSSQVSPLLSGLVMEYEST